MARGQYRKTKEIRVLEALVSFVEDPKSSPRTLARAGRAYLLPGADDALRDVTQSEALRHHLRAFLYDMAHQDKPTTAVEHRINVTLVMAGGPENVVALVDGDPRDVLLYQAFTVLQAVGTQSLRRCPAGDCRRAFVKRGRREYCSARCQRRVFLSTYDPIAAQPQRKESAANGKRKKTRTR